MARLRAGLERWRATLPPPPPVELYTSPDARLARELGALGYLDE